MTPRQVQRIVARDRSESEDCERLTPGCSINHTAEASLNQDQAEALGLDTRFDGCETW
jgi:hypothetical protein